MSTENRNIDWKTIKHKKLKKLLKLPIIEQKTTEWYEARQNVISASDFAQALGHGKFGTQKDIIIKKIEPTEYGTINNPFFDHGNLFEQVASDIYAKMHQVHIYEFGLLRHPTVSYAAASPDGITQDGIMLEIKCPLKRKITPGADVPTQYYYQIQGQLDVCDLDECDYFECELVTRRNIDEFKASNATKGVFVRHKNIKETLYGPLVLSAQDQDLSEIELFTQEHPNVTYWLLKTYNLKRVTRDKKFIDQVLLDIGKVWDKILFYRQNKNEYVIDILNKIEIKTEPLHVFQDAVQTPKIKGYAMREI